MKCRPFVQEDPLSRYAGSAAYRRYIYTKNLSPKHDSGVKNTKAGECVLQFHVGDAWLVTSTRFHISVMIFMWCGTRWDTVVSCRSPWHADHLPATCRLPCHHVLPGCRVTMDLMRLELRCWVPPASLPPWTHALSMSRLDSDTWRCILHHVPPEWLSGVLFASLFSILVLLDSPLKSMFMRHNAKNGHNCLFVVSWQILHDLDRCGCVHLVKTSPDMLKGQTRSVGHLPELSRGSYLHLVTYNKLLVLMPSIGNGHSVLPRASLIVASCCNLL